jgi:hypothetical protein
MRIGHVLEWIGVLGVLGGFAGFIIMGMRATGSDPSPVPIVIPFVAFIVSAIIGASGAAMVRSGRAKGL